MNLPASSAVFSADLHVPTATFAASSGLDCPVCCALAGEECAYTTAPVTLPVVADTELRPVHGYHASRLDAAGADLADTLGASAVVWDNGDAPRLAAPVVTETGDGPTMDGGPAAARDVLCRAKEKLGNLGYLLGELAAALGSPERLAALAAGLLDEDADDETEPYCMTCGEWAGIFHGHGDGWHHFRGEGTAASPIELYDAGHEVTPGRTVPAGRSLAPADIGIICQALADAGAVRAYKMARNRCGDREADRQLALAYQRLARRLAAADVAGDAPAETQTQMRTCSCGVTAVAVPYVFPHPGCDGSVPA